MKLKGGATAERVEFDMTPMIDCVFQLVVFFMLTLNFASDQQSEAVRLPSSELAKPADTPPGVTITLQLTQFGTVLVGSEETPFAQVRNALLREKTLLNNTPGKNFKMATIIIRADVKTPTGKVQELIRLCQEVGFEKFVLRAKESRV